MEKGFDDTNFFVIAYWAQGAGYSTLDVGIGRWTEEYHGGAEVAVARPPVLGSESFVKEFVHSVDGAMEAHLFRAFEKDQQTG